MRSSTQTISDNQILVILNPDHYQAWLDANRTEPQFLKSLLAS